MIKRIIFDVDGTLICNVHFEPAISKTLKKLNIFSKDNLNKFLFGISTYEKNYNSYNRHDYLKHFSQILEIKLKEEFINIFFEELKYIVPKEFKGIGETVKELSEKYEMVILSNYFSQSQKNRLNNMNIGHLFSEFHGEKIIKPNSQAYIDACGSNFPKECVMVGDNVDLDIKGALNVGLKAVLVNNGKQTDSHLNILKIEKIEDLTIEMIENL